MKPPAPQHQQSSPSDVSDDPKDFASTLRGGLQRKKQRVSPFDRIGAKLTRTEKPQIPNSYAE